MNKKEISIFFGFFLLHFLISSALYFISINGLLENFNNGAGTWFFARDTIKYFSEADFLIQLLSQNQIDILSIWDTYEINVFFMSIFGTFLFENFYPYNYFLFNSVIYFLAIFFGYFACRKYINLSILQSILSISFIFLPSMILHSFIPLREVFYFFAITLFFFSYKYLSAKNFKPNLTFFFLTTLASLVFVATRGYTLPIIILNILIYSIVYLFRLELEFKTRLSGFFVLVLIALITITSRSIHPVMNDMTPKTEKSLSHKAAQSQIKKVQESLISVNHDLEKKNKLKAEVTFLKDQSENTLGSLITYRINYLRYGFYRYEPAKEILLFDNFWHILKYAPNALMNVFFVPSFDSIFKASKTLGSGAYFFAVMENIYVLIFIVISIISLKYRFLNFLPILASSFLLISLLGYIVTNDGALIRLRLPYLGIIWLIMVSQFFYYKNQKKS